jgi:hypothetical protein
MHEQRKQAVGLLGAYTYARNSEYDFYRGTTAIVALQCVERTHSLNRQTTWTYCPKCDGSVYVQTQISC